MKKLYIFLYEVSQYISGSGITWDSHFDGIPCFPHGMHGIFISHAARIGKNCVIFHQVTIGSNRLSDSNGVGAPIIGNNCYIGVGAKIIGNVTVGNNVRIGVNCVVYKDVPDNSVVVSGTQKIIRKVKLINRFYSFHGRWVYYKDGRWVDETDQETIRRLSQGGTD